MDYSKISTILRRVVISLIYVVITGILISFWIADFQPEYLVFIFFLVIPYVLLLVGLINKDEKTLGNAVKYEIFVLIILLFCITFLTGFGD